MNTEIISKLVGLLQFQVDVSGLQRFERGLSQARQKMMALSREADALSRKLGTKMGVKVDSAAQEKLSKTVRANLDRELKLENAVQRTRRSTFTAELAGQKLINLRQKEGAAIQSQALRDKIAQAVVDAKSAKAEGERLKVSGAALKQAQSIEQHKARQARWEALLGQQQQKTAILQQKQFQAMTATQRAEFALQQARIRGHRAAEKFAASQEAAKLRAQRLDVSHAQRAERFQWAQTRQAAWAAKQAEPKPSTGFMGLGTGALALGGVTAGLAAIVGAVSALGDRLAATQTRVSESQQFSNILEQAAGRNPANKDFAKSEFLRISQKYGTAVDNDSAKDYRTYLLAQMARGKSLSAATADFETTMSAYRGAGLTRDEQRRTSLQYQQVRSKTVADREDLNTFSEAAPLLVEPIRRAWAERNKHALDANLERDFRASTKTGNLKAIDFENGIKLFVKENAAAIERQNGSIDANSTRLANQRFLQQQGLDQNPELIGAINDRIQAESELTEAMKPLKEAAVQADIALNKMAASFFRFTFGKDETPEQAAKKVDLFSPEQPAIDVSALSSPQPSTGSKPKDPISILYRWLTNTPDYDEGPASKVKTLEMNTLGMQFPKLDLSKFGITPPDETGQMKQFRLPPTYTAADIMETSAQQQRKQTALPSDWMSADDPNNGRIVKPAESNIDQSHTEVHNDITVNITTPPGSDEQVVGRIVRDEIGKVLQTARANQTEVE
ncbi:hypothetical protein E5170_02720 [Pseudomonas atacamensis]|uniref:Uncharacterized protein n=1 Tax=Pseudomonas atacamensis TaxID=2565368 RepID=A0AAQ2DFT5_9PSED|nr:hypothetical protein [Pseudomonas atacamensis]THF36377.1 hypothetical protein E5170_02720 [Pseudomonas atacamensis]